MKPILIVRLIVTPFAGPSRRRHDVLAKTFRWYLERAAGENLVNAATRDDLTYLLLSIVGTRLRNDALPLDPASWCESTMLGPLPFCKRTV